MVVPPQILGLVMAGVIVFGIFAVAGEHLIGIAELFQGAISSIPATFAAGGFTVTSISQTGIQVNQGTVTGKYIVTAVADRGSQNVIGTIQPWDFKSATSWESAQPFTITMANLKETARFKVTNYQTPVWQLQYITQAKGVGCSSAYSWLIPGGFQSSYDLCVKKVQVATTGDLSLTSIRSEVDISIASGGKTESVKLSSDQTTGQWADTGVLGTAGTVHWTGGTVTGNYPPEANDWTPFYDKQTSSWKMMITGSEFSQINSRWSTIQQRLTTLAGQWTGHDLKLVESEINNYRSFILGIQNSDDSFNKGFVWVGRNDEGAAGTRLDYPLNIATLNPVLVFTIDARWVGVKSNQGTPSILGVTPPTNFKSGDPGAIIKVNTRNSGSGSGAFDFSLESCSAFSQTYAITGIQFSIGQTKTVDLPIKSTGPAVDTTEQCTVKVCDQAGGGCDTASVTISMKEARFCTEGEFRSDGRCIFKCVNNVYTQQGNCCQHGTEQNLITGVWGCKSPPSGGGLPGGGGGTGDLWSQIVTFLIMWFVGFLIGLVLLLLLALFIPPLKLIMATNLLLFLGLAAILGVIFAVIFALPVASIAVAAHLL